MLVLAMLLPLSKYKPLLSFIVPLSKPIEMVNFW